MKRTQKNEELMSVFRVTEKGVNKRNKSFEMSNQTIITALDKTKMKPVWKAQATTSNKILSKGELDILSNKLDKLHKEYKDELTKREELRGVKRQLLFELIEPQQL